MHLLSVTLGYISIPKNASIQTHSHFKKLDIVLGHNRSYEYVAKYIHEYSS
jgi:hypothetical protein